MQRVFLTNTDIRKNQILEATYQCIYEQGIAGITIRSIAKKAKVNQASLIYYFQNKKNLLREFIEALFDRLISELKSNVDDLASPEKKLEDALNTGKTFCIEQKEMFVVFVSCWSFCVRDRYMRTLLARHYSRLLNVLEDILDEGQKKGVFNKLNKKNLSILMMSFANGFSLIYCTMPQRSFKANDHYDMFVDNFRSIVLKKKNN